MRSFSYEQSKPGSLEIKKAIDLKRDASLAVELVADRQRKNE